MGAIGDLGGLGKSAGIASGLSAGVDAFFKVKQQLSEQDIKKQLANAQGTEAYAKLVHELGTDLADPIARQNGLIQGPPEGLIQQPPQGLVQPTAEQPEAKQSSGPGLMAPDAKPLNANISPQAQQQASMAPAGYQDPMGDVKSYQKRLMSVPEPVRNAMIARDTKTWEQNQPQAVASLQNTKNEPTDKAVTGFQPTRQRMDKVARTYMDLQNILKKGGEGSVELTFSKLARLNNPDSDRPDHELIGDLEKNPQVWNRIKDALSKRSTGELSEDTRREISEQAKNLFGGQLQSYKAAAADAEDRGSFAGAKPGFTKMSIVGQAEKAMGHPLDIEKKPGGGLLSPPIANAADSVRFRNAPAAQDGKPMSRAEFKAWKTKNAKH